MLWQAVFKDLYKTDSFCKPSPSPTLAQQAMTPGDGAALPSRDAALELHGAKHVQTKTNFKLETLNNNETVATMKQVRRSPVPTPAPVHTRARAHPHLPPSPLAPAPRSRVPPQLTSDHSPLIPARRPSPRRMRRASRRPATAATGATTTESSLVTISSAPFKSSTSTRRQRNARSRWPRSSWPRVRPRARPRQRSRRLRSRPRPSRRPKRRH